MIADIVVDLQYGDCGKGKVAHDLLKKRRYTHVLRYNGGCNAGHTIFHEGKKFITRHIPVGVFFGIKSIIGFGCVLDPEQFFKELAMLEAGGVSTKGLIFVAQNTHIITQTHKDEDGGSNERIGTTRSGNGQAYRDKYARTGIRAEDVPELKPFLIDLYEEFHRSNPVILCEGAQGFGLDIDWGVYPFVTSSHCTAGGAVLNGIPPRAVRDVWGVAKIYETYVGSRKFEPDSPIFQSICEIGEEFGSNTGRRRQCNWMSWDLLEKAVRVNGVTHVVFSKMDVLREVGVWKVLENGREIIFSDESGIKGFLTERLRRLGIGTQNIYFSGYKDRI